MVGLYGLGLLMFTLIQLYYQPWRIQITQSIWTWNTTSNAQMCLFID